MACLLVMLCIVILGLFLPKPFWFHPWTHLRDETRLTIAEVESKIGNGLLVVWVTGMGLVAIRWSVGAYQIRSILCRARRVELDRAAFSEPLQRVLDSDSSVVPFIYESEHVNVPFCYQLQTPVIVIPKSLLEDRGEELDDIIMHECVHLQSAHPMQLFLQRLLELACWYHPSIATVSRQLSLSREFICDDCVAESGRPTAKYLSTLVKIANTRPPRVELSLGFAPRANDLLIRVSRLAMREQDDGHRNTHSAHATRWKRALWCIAIVVIALIDVPLNVLRSPYASTSPWPKPTVQLLDAFNIRVPDFEPYHHSTQISELRDDL